MTDFTTKAALHIVPVTEIVIFHAQITTSGAELVNHLWKLSKSHLLHLSGENMMQFLSARAVFINLRNIAHNEANKSDIGKVNIKSFVRNLWTCDCLRCQ